MPPRIFAKATETLREQSLSECFSQQSTSVLKTGPIEVESPNEEVQDALGQIS